MIIVNKYKLYMFRHNLKNKIILKLIFISFKFNLFR